jgi:hypothetical protein
VTPKTIAIITITLESLSEHRPVVIGKTTAQIMASEGSQIATSIDEKPRVDGGGEPCVSAAVSFQYQIAW